MYCNIVVHVYTCTLYMCVYLPSVSPVITSVCPSAYNQRTNGVNTLQSQYKMCTVHTHICTSIYHKIQKSNSTIYM